MADFVLSGPLARAARALVKYPRPHVAKMTGLSEDVLADFEGSRADLPEDGKARLKAVLEEGGAVFLPESDGFGAGVRLKFTKKDAKAITRMEGEGGPVGSDDV